MKADSRTYDIASVAIMSALLEVCKIALNAIPNVELVSFLLIVFTRHFGPKKAVLAAWIFTALEIFQWGFHLWVIFYVYTWPVLVLVTWLLRRHRGVLVTAAASGAFGFCFGALSSLVYLFMGDPAMAFSWWVSGLSFDAVHGVSNFCIALALYRPAMYALQRVSP